MLSAKKFIFVSISNLDQLMAKLQITHKKAGKLSNQIYKQILDWLMSGMLQENDKLPSEKELCNSFEVSRPVVREAITMLQEDKLVHTHKGKGTYVLHSPLKKLGSFATANEIAGILQSHEVRIALESEASALAASRRTDKDILKLKKAIKGMQKNFDEERLSIQEDFDFHLAIAEATNNEIFVRLFEDIHIGLRQTMAVAQSLSRDSVKTDIDPKRNKEVIEEHQKIIDAIEMQDHEAARLAMRYHISRIKQRIINIRDKK